MGKFDFKQFSICDDRCGMKLSTDSVLLGAWVAAKSSPSILDIGSGSGILCLMMAQRYENARITGIEIDHQAYLDAVSNIKSSPWSERIALACCDVNDYQIDNKADLIISNPPYFDSKLRSPQQQRDKARHVEALSAMTVLDFAKKNLNPQGTVAIIFPAEQSNDVIFHAEIIGLKLRRQCMVAAVEGRPALRAMMQFALCDGPLEKTALDIRDLDNNYTKPYRQLTRDFYLNF